jgi:hypothetical protein
MPFSPCQAMPTPLRVGEAIYAPPLVSAKAAAARFTDRPMDRVADLCAGGALRAQ